MSFQDMLWMLIPVFLGSILGGVVDACYDGYNQEATCGFYYTADGQKVIDSQVFCYMHLFFPMHIHIYQISENKK